MHDEFYTSDETDRNLLSQNYRLRLYQMAAVIKSKGTMSKY